MSGILMGLGPFRFETARHSYEQMERRAGGKWAAQERIGRRVANQFTGIDEGEVTISATLYPQVTGGIAQVEAMSASAEAGDTHMLVSGGKVYGRWFIREVRETGSFFERDGTPRKIEVQITLGRYGEDGSGLGGGLF